MVWEKAFEHVDEAQGLHLIVLRNGAAEHQVMIHIGHDGCPTCGHVVAKNNLSELDPAAHVKTILQQLNASSAAIVEYARKHRVPLKR